MNKLYIKVLIPFLLFLSAPFALLSQNIAINTTGAKSSVNAVLDLNTGNAGNMGLILPHVSLNTDLTKFNAPGPMANAATAGDVGMLVYNTNSAAGRGAGYYYWNGTTWVSLEVASGTVTSCSTSTPGYFPYFTNDTNLCTSALYQSGAFIGMGTTTPQNVLDISGASVIGSSYAGTSTAPPNGLLVQGQVGIGTSNPNTNAELDVTSSLFGILIPRLSSAPVTTTTSLLYYNTSSGCFMFYNGTTWQKMTCACTSSPATPTIGGATSTCINTTATYTCTAIANDLYYTWVVPSTMGTITSGQGTATITVATASTPSSFNQITVTSTNSCGTSPNATSAYISVNPGPSAFTITQTNTNDSHFGCPGVSSTFSVTAVTGNTYAWSVSSAACGTISGSSTTNTVAITGGTGATGTVTCIESNACANLSATYTINTTGHGSKTFSADGIWYFGTVQQWDVPACVSVITITAVGAEGNSSALAGGDGATVTETFTVLAGNTFRIIVGQTGLSYGYSGGGGGASIVYSDSIPLGTSGDYPLIVAGGGGGGGGTGAAGLAAGTNSSAHTGAAGALGGAGAVGGGAYGGGAGAGWFTGTGATGTNKIGYGGNGSSTFTNPFYGGSGSTNSSHHGGYGAYGGGGGGGDQNTAKYGGGGGGGGFTGGSGGSTGTTQATDYGGGGGTSGYYTYPDEGYGTAAGWTTVAGTANGTIGSVTITW